MKIPQTEKPQDRGHKHDWSDHTIVMQQATRQAEIQGRIRELETTTA